MKFLRPFVSVFLCCFAHLGAAGPQPPEAARPFMEKHCFDCHDADTKKGGLDLTSYPFDLNDPKNFTEWVKVHDRVRDGEMPPKKKDKPRPDEAAQKAFLADLAMPMIASDKAHEAAEGRATWRRLNRYEYENTLRDLLHAPWLQIKEMLPEDGESHRFNKIGDALDVSHVQMARYLTAADYALRQVMASQVSKPEVKTLRFYARQQPSFLAKLKFTNMNKSPERSTFPMIGTTAQPELAEGKGPVTVGDKNPQVRDQEAFGVVSGSYEPIELRFDQFKTNISGHYKLRFCAYSFWAGPMAGENKWWHPDRANTSPGHRDEPVSVYSETPPRLLRRLGAFDVTPKPTTKELDVWLLRGETIRVDAARLFRSRPPNYHNPLAQRDGQPGVAFRWMEVVGPLNDQWPTAGHKLLFGDLPLKPAQETVKTVSKTPGSGGIDNGVYRSDKKRGKYKNFDEHETYAQVIAAAPAQDAERLLRAFMARAYRDPVQEEDVHRFLPIITGALKSGSTFADAMIAGYSAVLCSPAFVCLQEKPGPLNDYALAERLSCFLWNSEPDDELRELAAQGELHQPEVLRAQAKRLLADAKSQRFVDAFLDYWLDLRKMEATSPDATLYPDYYLDDLLTDSAEEETRLFFAELLKHDLPARNIVSSNFAMLNERLAQHYGLPTVKGVALRRVALPPDSPRGGLITQASILKVTANGTTTSPVLRGAWIMERVLGKPPPPPPANVPAIEPDTRGATTIREQLERHRKLETCAACHAKIDPAGFALENFDVMGGWRDKYRALGEGEHVVGYGKNGQKFTFHFGQPVDASGNLPDGRNFHDVRELKKLLLADERAIARNLVQQLLVYSTGAPVRFGDRPDVEVILDHAAASHFGVSTIVQEIVQSPLFQMK